MTTRIASTNIQSNTILTTNLASSTIAALQGSTVPTITQIQITDSSYVVKDDTAVSTSGGYIKITGTNFTAGSQVVIGSTPATSVGFVNSTTLNVQVPPLAAGTYVVYVTINTGSVAIMVNGLTYSGDPTWVTGSTLPAGQINSAISIQLSATGDAPVTYALQAGSSLPAGLSLTSGGLLSGTVSGISVETTYNFTIEAIDAQAQESPRTFSITISASDQYFDYVTTLLSASNPASTFVSDASTNNFAVSVFGDTRPNNFGPYTPGYYSNYFDGTGDYLTIANNSNLDITSTDFTLEVWYYRTTQGTVQNLFSMRSDNPSTGYEFRINANNTLQFFYTGGSSLTTTDTVPSNSWVHIAATRSGTTVRLFINGVVSGSATFSNGTTNTLSAFRIGADSDNGFLVTGYLSNARLVKGTAVYTSGFTPSTTPLAAIANTQLLTCQSNRFIDNSTNNFTITRNGDTQVSGFDPFAPNSSYSTYGSGYFDGTTDYLTIADNAAFGFGTGDYTVEFWLYLTALPGSGSKYTIIDFRPTNTGVPHTIYISNSGGTLYLGFFNGSSDITSSSQPVSVNAWTHCAYSRSSGTLRIYVNGVQAYSAANSVDYQSSRQLTIGAGVGLLEYLTGYLSNLRIVKGTAVYTSAFTPPAAPLTAITNTSLLTLQNNQPNNNNMFLDSSTNNFPITRNGNTTQGSFSPYGGGWSNFFDGNGDFLSIASNAAFAFGTGDFTVEAWIMRTGGSGTQAICQSDAVGSSTNDKWFFAVSGTGLIFSTHDAGGFSGTTTTTFNIGVWYHVAASRSSGTLRMFVNGVNTAFAATGNPSGYNLGQNGFSIGAVSTPIYWTGYISNLRVTKGTALYTSTFTPSTAPLTPIANTSLLTCADNRFIDDRANNFTITRNGDTSIQRFNPFNPVLTTPTSYSGYFDGTGDYLTAPANSAFAFGTGDFTVEAWIFIQSYAVPRFVFDTRSSASTAGMGFRVQTNGSLGYSDNANNTLTSTGLVQLNTWTHVAWVRSGSTLTGYVNGVNGGSVSNSANITQNNGVVGEVAFSSGEGMFGYISNLRVVKGTAVYTGNFTPSTTPLTAVSGTSLLTLQNATFVDNSTNNFTISANGNSQPIQFNPFGWTTTTGSAAAYSVSNYGGSMYFDGTGDFLTVPDSTAFTMGAGDFTLECWINLSTISGAQVLIGTCDAAGSQSSMSFILQINSGTPRIGVGYAGTVYYATAASAITPNQWYHIAGVRNGASVYIYVNGVRSAPLDMAALAITDSSQVVGIGRNGNFNGEYVTGYISNLRIVKGQALYTSNFAPPVAPLAFNANAVLQVNGTSAAVYDSSMITTYETLGNASSTTVIKKYGNSSIAFDGTGDYLISNAPTTDLYAFASGDFTIEMWVNFAVVGSSGVYTLYDSRPNGSQGAYANIALDRSTAKIYYYVSSAIRITGTTTIVANTWYHIAICRSGTSTKLFINGTQEGSTWTDSTVYLNSANRPVIAASGSSIGNEATNGYIDDLRITKGIARYTSNFTPTTTPFIQF